MNCVIELLLFFFFGWVLNVKIKGHFIYILLLPLVFHQFAESFYQMFYEIISAPMHFHLQPSAFVIAYTSLRINLNFGIGTIYQRLMVKLWNLGEESSSFPTCQDIVIVIVIILVSLHVYSILRPALVAFFLLA